MSIAMCDGVGQEEFAALSDALSSKPEPIDTSGPIVLWGAGALGSWTIRAMRAAGMPDPTLFDSNPAKWGKEVEGVKIQDGVMGKFPENALWVVTVFTGESLRKELQERVTYTPGAPFGRLRVSSFAQFYRSCLLGKPDVQVPYGALDRPEEIKRHEMLIRQAHKLWDDDQSRAEFVEQIRYRISLRDPRTQSLPPSETYFPPELKWHDNEYFVDCGAFDGDTTEAFTKRYCSEHKSGQFRVLAIEADHANCEKLRHKVWDLTLNGLVQVAEAAVHSRSGIIKFKANGTAGSKVDPDGTPMQAFKLDDLLINQKPTRIKMDIEGAEPMALVGASKTITKHKPNLAICLYHAPNHLWEIPIYLKSIVPEYKLYLRRYSDDCWETVCYATL